ncbi:MAG: MqnA/MqnD/SBP family protein [Bacteroidales bacterium]|jgi:NitT/TauT family transport system substrate-binding protein|nr:MqnA/MqnD/SBP family protein [Bacteroidales bacterium]
MRRLLLLTYILLITLVGCNNKPSNNKITIATLKGPSAMGMIKMIDSLSNTENSTIEISIYNEPVQIRKLMLENTVDFAILPTTMGAILYNKAITYQLAAIPVWGTLYLFGTDSTIRTWSNLKGKRIHLMGKGMTPDVLFKYLMLKNGIDPDKDVELDYSFPTHIDLANAVAAEKADLAVISEPMVSIVMQKNINVHALFDLNTEWQKVHSETPIAQTAFLVKSSFAKENTEKLIEILEHYKYSTDWVNNNTDSAAALIVKHQILPTIEVAKQSIPRSNLHVEIASKIKPEIYNYLEIFYSLNPAIIGGKIPDDEFIIDINNSK